MSSVMHAQADRALRALVIDDDPIVRRFISSVLGASGFEVLEATDAKQALVAFYAVGSAVDLVITDIRMPGIDGCELARMLLAADPTLPILLVSGSHSESAASFPFLQKPFTSALCSTRCGKYWHLKECCPVVSCVGDLTHPVGS